MAAPRRTLLSGLLLLLVSLAGAVLFRRRRSPQGEQVDLTLADGSRARGIREGARRDGAVAVEDRCCLDLG